VRARLAIAPFGEQHSDDMSATIFVASLEARAREIVERCSRCGRCVEVCPTAGPAGVDRSDPPAVVGHVLELLRGAGDPASTGAR